MTSAPTPIVLDVWADIACPWCFIGHRHLGQVVPADGLDVLVRHRAFQLQPDLPPRGAPMRPFFEEKFGGPEAMSEVFAQVKAVGEQVGIAFDFEAMPVAPNTVLAHRALAALAHDPADQRAATHALFSAYFERGFDVTDPLVVGAVVAEATGRSDVDELLGPASLTAVEDDLAHAAALGISAVPTFVADGRIAVQGAQPPEVLRALLDRAAAGHPPAS
jgi:predicted DsbA family dithiol-disulfide isomerase